MNRPAILDHGVTMEKGGRLTVPSYFLPKDLGGLEGFSHLAMSGHVILCRAIFFNHAGSKRSKSCAGIEIQLQVMYSGSFL